MPALHLDGHSIGLRYEFEHDRFCCKLVALSAGQSTRLIVRSCQQASSGTNLCGPIIQQAVMDMVAGGRPAILGIGMSGKTHWSSSIVWDAANNQFFVDIACRCGDVPASLGTTFTCADQITTFVQGDCLLLVLAGNVLAEMIPLENCRIEPESTRITIRPTCVNFTKLPATVRWLFGIRSPRKNRVDWGRAVG
jgi:hypothetical protein